MRINFVSFSQWLILCGIVCGKYGEVIMLILFFFLLLTFKKGQIYNCKGIIVFFFLLGSYTIPLLLFNGYSLAKFIQQYTLLFFCVFIYRQFFILNRTNLDALWNKYIRISYYVSVLGIIQFIICLFIGIDIFPNAFVPDGRVMRIHSIFQEAGNLGTFLIPAVAYIVFSRNFFLTHIRLSLIVLVVELLTFTTIAYTAFLLIFVTWCYTSFKSIRYLLMGIVVFVFYSFITSTQVLSDNGNDLFLVMKTKFIQTIPKADNFSPNEFAGWVSGEDKKYYYQSAKAFIFTSRWYETFGLVVAEMKSYGIPCIVPDRCAASEQIEEGKTGYIFESGNLESLKECICKYEQTDIIKLQNNILDISTSQKYSMEEHIKVLLNVYEGILL